MLNRKGNHITICFLSHSAGNTGAEKGFTKLLEGLKKIGINVYVILPCKGPIIKEFEKRNIIYSIIRYSRWLNSDSRIIKRIVRTIKNILFLIPTIIKIKKWKSDIVYTNTSTICIGAISAKLIRLPHIWHFKEFGYEDYGYTYDIGKRLSQWLTSKLATIYLVNSNAVAQKYKHFIPEEKLNVIYESYYNSEMSEIPDHNEIYIRKCKFNCVIVGTIVKSKGQLDAIKAINELHRKGMNIKLFIVGDGEENYKKELHRLVEQFDLNENIEFLGYLDNPITIIKQCDVLLMCSKNEAYGLVTLEAMQIGKPVIGTKSGGTVELIKENFNGLFYLHGDYIELSQKIKYLYNNPNIAKKMGENAKTWSENNFDPQQYINQTLAIISKLVN
jgi:glycosyltransferase involved in cell wall biosynthesis